MRAELRALRVIYSINLLGVSRDFGNVFRIIGIIFPFLTKHQ